ncbi:MAG: 2-oxoacid:acceptor oxidoreductase subunit alpha [Salinibacter sp.]
MTTTTTTQQRLVQGNEACAHGALYAGCDFYAGYPITPASEVMEILSRELPKRNGSFIQMEDEIGSVSAIVGAAWGGAKAMTATSGPGFSLMQEGLGYAAMTETPCVIMNAQRWGPSTGQPTKPSQGDLMQAIWGTHGDHPVVVLTASSIRDVFETTVMAFNVAEEYRVPVVLLLDEKLAHMRENMVWPEPGDLKVIDRERPADEADFEPFGSDEFVPFGEGLRFTVSGLAHDEWGALTENEEAGALLRRLTDKIQDHARDLAHYESLHLDDARRVVVSYGITSRPAESAVHSLRKQGIRAGLLDLKTLWPFPDFLFEALDEANLILVPELNRGQLVREVQRAAYERLPERVPIKSLGRVDGRLLTPERIADALTEGRKDPESLRDGP